MTKKEIENTLESESGIILLEKRSSHTFLEYIFSNWISLISTLYFVGRKKMDTLILTEKRFIYLIKNRVYLELEFNGIDSLKYDVYKSVLEIIAEKKYSIPLERLEINQNESNFLNQRLSEFMERNNGQK